VRGPPDLWSASRAPGSCPGSLDPIGRPVRTAWTQALVTDRGPSSSPAHGHWVTDWSGRCRDRPSWSRFRIEAATEGGPVGEESPFPLTQPRQARIVASQSQRRTGPHPPVREVGRSAGRLRHPLAPPSPDIMVALAGCQADRFRPLASVRYPSGGRPGTNRLRLGLASRCRPNDHCGGVRCRGVETTGRGQASCPSADECSISNSRRTGSARHGWSGVTQYFA